MIDAEHKNEEPKHRARARSLRLAARVENDDAVKGRERERVLPTEAPDGEQAPGAIRC
jgi:hypothetical protein